MSSTRRLDNTPWQQGYLVISQYDYGEGIAIMRARFYTGLNSIISYSSPFGKELIKNKCSTVTIVDQAISDMIFGDSHKT